MKRVTRIPEDLILKAELGIYSVFLFKNKEYMYSISLGNLCILTQRGYDEHVWRIVNEYDTIEKINAFLGSGKFYHWHVDIGVREENLYRVGKRYSVPFFRAF